MDQRRRRSAVVPKLRGELLVVAVVIIVLLAALVGVPAGDADHSTHAGCSERVPAKGPPFVTPFPKAFLEAGG